MKTILKIYFVVFVFCGVSFSQSVTWQRYYNENYENEGRDVIQTFDGGFAILSNNYGPMGVSAEIKKTDLLGNIQWGKTYDINNVGGQMIICYTITQEA